MKTPPLTSEFNTKNFSSFQQQREYHEWLNEVQSSPKLSPSSPHQLKSIETSDSNHSASSSDPGRQEEQKNPDHPARDTRLLYDLYRCKSKPAIAKQRIEHNRKKHPKEYKCN